MRITNLLTRLMPRPKLFKTARYQYGRKISRNLAPISQATVMLTLIVYMVGLFLAPTQAARGTIEHYSATRVAEQTQTGTSTNWTAVTGTANTGTTASTNGWIDSSNLTAGEDYLVMVWGEHSTNNTAGRSGIRVVRGSTPTAFAESQAIEETDNSGAAFKTPYFWFTIWTAVADEDLEVQFYNDLNTHTAAVEDVTLMVMNAEDLVANSELIYDIDTGGGTNSTTFTMRSSITWTPATANDTWWVGGYIKHDQAGTADQAEGRFDLNAGTIRALHSIEGEDANDTPLYGMGWAQQFAASSQTIEVETREDAAVSGGSEWDATGIFALRLDGFETFKAYGVAGDGTALTANNTYVEQGNVDHQQLSEGNYLVAAGAVVDDNGGVVNSKLTLADTDITDPTGGYSHNNADTVPTTMADMQIDSTLGLNDLDFDAQRTSATQAELQDRWVVAFSMERAGPPAELTIDGYIFENDDATTVNSSYGIDAGGSGGGGDGSFPVREEVTARLFGSAATTHNAALPATVNPGDRILAHVITFTSTDIVTTPGSWTRLGSSGHVSGDGVRAGFYYLTADAVGNEDGTNVNWATSSSVEMVVQYIRYQVGTFDPSTAPEAAVAAPNGQPDPPNLSVSWGAENTQWIASFGQWDPQSASTPPTNYGSQDWQESGGGDQVGGAVAFRNLNASSENPGTFTSGFDDSVTFTVGIRPLNVGPTVASVTPTQFASSSTTHNVQMPATVDAGDLLLVFFENDGCSDVASVTGFTEIREMNSADCLMVWAKDAAGNEDGTTINWQTAGATIGVAQTYRITADSWFGDLAGVEASAGAFNAGSTTPDPDSLTPSWGAADNMWIVAMAADNYSSTVTVPTNFTNLTTHVQTDTLSSARRAFNGTSLDPGSFTIGSSVAWYAGTVAIRPAGAGGNQFDDAGEVSGGTQQAGSEFSSGQAPTEVRVGERLNLRVHLTNSGGTLTDLNELALFYDRSDGIWSKVADRSVLQTAPPSGEDCNTQGSGSSQWQCDTVAAAATQAAGNYSSIAMTPDGRPMISFYDNTSSRLRVAEYVGSGGDCDGSGGSDAWSCTTVEATGTVGLYNSLAFDTYGNPWISYYDTTNDNLKVARYVSSGGNCDDTGGSDAWECTVIDVTDDVGRFSSIAITAQNEVWIAYRDLTSFNLKVAQFVGSQGNCDDTGGSDAWECTTVEATGTVGQFISLATDADGMPWISYYDENGLDIKVVTYVRGAGNCDAAGGSDAWQCTTVDANGDVGTLPAIAFDSAGTAWVAYSDSTNDDQKIAHYVGSGGNCDATGGSDEWECTVIDATGNIGAHSGLAMSPDGEMWTTYVDEDVDDLRLARFVGGGGNCDDTGGSDEWECLTIDADDDVGKRSSIAFDAVGRPWISYTDSTNETQEIAMLPIGGEIISSRSQDILNGAAITTSRADMTSVNDTSNRDSADCVATATWNDGQYFEGEGGPGIELPDGLGADQCTEVMWTIDTAQATPGTTYRFIVATADNFQQDQGLWRGPVAINEYPTLTMAQDEDSIYRYGKDRIPTFANCNTDTAWGCSVVDDTDGGAQYTSTGFDPDGNPWTSYYESTGGDLKVARYVGSGGSGCASEAWHCMTIDSTDDVGLYTSLAFDNEGMPWVSYYDTTNDNLKVARYVGSGGTGCDLASWSCEVVDSTNDTGQHTSLGFDSAGRAWVTYYDVTTSDLATARYVGTAGTGCANIAWTCSAIESVDDIGSYNSLAFDRNGSPWVSYYDATSDDLKVARYAGLGNTGTCEIFIPPPAPVETLLTSGNSAGTSVNTASISPASNSLVLAAVGSAVNGSGNGGPIPTMTGNGLTWVQVATRVSGDDGRVTLFRAMGSSPSSGAATIAASPSADMAWVIIQVENVDTSGTNGSGAVAQSATNGGITSALTVTLAAFQNSQNPTYGAFYLENDTGAGDITAGSGFSQFVEVNRQGTQDLSQNAQWRDDADTTVDATFSSSTESAGVAVEIVPTAAGSGVSNSDWNCETVDATDDVGQYSSIAFDATGDAWISYYDNTGGNLEVANYVGTGGDCDSVGAGSDSWECTTVDSTDNVGRFSSIGFDATGAAWVSYLDFTNTDLNAARYVGGSGGDCNSTAWDCMDISSSAAGDNAYSAIAFDMSGTPWISHEGTSTNSLNMTHLHMPPTKPTKNIVIPYATRSALSSDARYRLDSGLSPNTDPYGTCGSTTDKHGYCGLYHHEGIMDSMPARTGERPMYSLATRFSSNTQLPTALVMFQSTIAPNTENVVLQVYRFGSTNAWETVSTYNSAGCTTASCSLRAQPSGTPSDYYETDGSNYWVYFRVYQTEYNGNITLKLDHFTAEQTAKFLRGGRVFRESQTDPLGW